MDFCEQAPYYLFIYINPIKVEMFSFLVVTSELDLHHLYYLKEEISSLFK
jgi:hypothetical protein